MMNCFCEIVDQQKAFRPHFQQRPLPEILTITNLQQALNRIRTCAESEFKLSLMTSRVSSGQNELQ